MIRERECSEAVAAVINTPLGAVLCASIDRRGWGPAPSGRGLDVAALADLLEENGCEAEAAQARLGNLYPYRALAADPWDLVNIPF